MRIILRVISAGTFTAHGPSLLRFFRLTRTTTSDWRSKNMARLFSPLPCVALHDLSASSCLMGDGGSRVHNPNPCIVLAVVLLRRTSRASVIFFRRALLKIETYSGCAIVIRSDATLIYVPNPIGGRDADWISCLPATVKITLIFGWPDTTSRRSFRTNCVTKR